MYDKVNTVGELLLGTTSQNIKYQDSRRNRLFTSQVSVKEEQEDKDDIFSLEFGQKNEVKLQGDMIKGQTYQPDYRDHNVTKILRWKQQPNSNKETRVEVNYVLKNNKKEVFLRQNEPFHHQDIWNPERHFRKQPQRFDDPVVIPSLVPLPVEKHVLSKPQEYHAIGQHIKKKMYRPVVPKIFHSGYDTYLQRRKKIVPQKDLAVLSLDQVVQQCYNKLILPLDIFTRYMNLNGTCQIIKQFLQCWTTASLYRYDFNRTPFTMLDHRRLSELLLHLFPKQYTIGSIDAFHVDEKEFLRKVYYLNDEDYVKCYLTLDSISNCTWWNQIKLRHKNTEHHYYFQLKEKLNSIITVVQNYSTPQAKSVFLRETLGPLNLQDGQAELQKILSNKFKNGPRVFTSEESMMNYREERDEDTGTSHDNQTDQYSRTQMEDQSARAAGGSGTPNWSKGFAFQLQSKSKQKNIYYGDTE